MRRAASRTVLLLALSGCALPAPTVEPVPSGSTSGTSSRPVPERPPVIGELGTHTPTRLLARDLFGRAEHHRVAALTSRSLTHRQLWSTLGPLVDSADGMHREEVGRSVEGRPLYAIHVGRGPLRVMLWSQMHGNEPTATLALADLIHYVSHNDDDPLVRRLRERLTVIAVPMLNPDGAERSRRENAMGIDLNRDARRQASPEGRALAALHARLSPRFGFNLHDQERRVGDDGRTIAISLLAPPHDPARSDTQTQTRAKYIAALMRVAADSLVDGRVTRFDDAYNPHAFGDAMQSWGTSTVLVETGAWENDDDKEYLRRVNFALLLTALDAIASASYTSIPLHEYESLPANPAPGQRR